MFDQLIPTEYLLIAAWLFQPISYAMGWWLGRKRLPMPDPKVIEIPGPSRVEYTAHPTDPGGARFEELVRECDGYKVEAVALRNRLADVLAIPSSDIHERAVALVREQETYKDRGGEAKRHQVYARLQKEFPGLLKRKISRIIEDAVEAA